MLGVLVDLFLKFLHEQQKANEKRKKKQPLQLLDPRTIQQLFFDAGEILHCSYDKIHKIGTDYAKVESLATGKKIMIFKEPPQESVGKSRFWMWLELKNFLLVCTTKRNNISKRWAETPISNQLKQVKASAKGIECALGAQQQNRLRREAN